ncbi:retrovirus-related pol polyprotein from transposon TNT 1-94 [Tanacetum coccineum]
MDIFTKGALWDYWKMGSNEIEPTNDETSDLEETNHDDEQEIGEIFRIETNLFDYKTPMCGKFKEFNYLLKIDPDLLTKDIEGFKTYKEYKDDWIYEWNRDVPWVDEKPWIDTGVWTEPTLVKHYCKPFNYKTGCSEWPTCSWNNDGYCNGGNLLGAYIVGNSLHYQDYEWIKKLLDDLRVTAVKVCVTDAKLKLQKLYGKLLSSEWNTHAVMWRNKAELQTISMYDLYKNLNVYEPEVKGTYSSSSSTQNMAFVSLSNNNDGSSNEVVNTAQTVNTAYGVSTVSTQVNTANSSNIDNLSDAVIYAFLASQPNSPQLVTEDLQQIHPYDIEEMDLRWQMAMLTMRARRFLKNTKRRLTVDSNENIIFDKSKVKCYNCHKKGHFARTCRATESQMQEQESSRRNIQLETSTSTALVLVMVLEWFMVWIRVVTGRGKDLNYASWPLTHLQVVQNLLRKKLEIAQKEKDSIQLNVDKFENASKSLDKLIECQIVDICKKGLGYNVVPPPYTGNFMPPTPDLSFTGLDVFANKFVVENSAAKSSEEVSKGVRKSDDSLIIKDWVSDSEEEDVSQTKTEKKTVKP